MKTKNNRDGREGFTLIEILVVLILLAILAAAVFPVLTQQTGTADPVRVANDLSSLKTGVQAFRLDMRPEFPGDLEDLAFKPSSTTELTIDDNPYGSTLADRWNGPYVDLAVTEDFAAVASGNAFATGYSAQVLNEMFCFDKSTNQVVAGNLCGSGDAVAVQLSGLSPDMFNAIDEIIDGEAASTTGNFRQNVASSSAFYFLSPYH